MKATVSISIADVDEAQLRSILALLSPVAQPENTDMFVASPALVTPENGYIHFPGLKKLMDLGEEPAEQSEQPAADHTPVREFAPIEVRTRHLPVLQKLKKGKATAKQLASKLPGSWTQQEVSNSLAYLKRYGLVERQVGSRYWVATSKAQAHDLVAA